MNFNVVISDVINLMKGEAMGLFENCLWYRLVDNYHELSDEERNQIFHIAETEISRFVSRVKWIPFKFFLDCYSPYNRYIVKVKNADGTEEEVRVFCYNKHLYAGGTNIILDENIVEGSVKEDTERLKKYIQQYGDLYEGIFDEEETERES